MLIALVWDQRNLAGLVASLVCLLIVAITLGMLAELDRAPQDRGWEQAESVRGLFDEQPDAKHATERDR
jgi:hypothetical protein